jgi:hypothetical protein
MCNQLQVLIVVGLVERNGAVPAAWPPSERMTNVAEGVTRPARTVA